MIVLKWHCLVKYFWMKCLNWPVVKCENKVINVLHWRQISSLFIKFHNLHNQTTINWPDNFCVCVFHTFTFDVVQAFDYFFYYIWSSIVITFVLVLVNYFWIRLLCVCTTEFNFAHIFPAISIKVIFFNSSLRIFKIKKSSKIIMRIPLVHKTVSVWLSLDKIFMFIYYV